MFQYHGKTCLRWTLFLGTLVGLGTVIYQLESHEPVWETARGPRVAEEPKWILGVYFSPDGENVITYSEAMYLLATTDDDAKEILEPDSVTVWNRRTGERRAQYPKTGRFTNVPTFSKDFRYCVGEHSETKEVGDEVRNFLCLVDLKKGRETILPTSPKRNYSFSPNAEILIGHDIEGSPNENTLTIYDVAGEKILGQYPCFERAKDGDISFVPYFFARNYLVFKSEPIDTTFALWSLAQKKLVGTMRKDGWQPYGLSRGGGAIIMRRIAAMGDEPISKYALWDLASQEFKINSTAWLHGVCDLESPDGRWAADYSKASGISLWDRAAEKKCGSSEFSVVYDYSSFTPDSRFLIWPRRAFYPEFDLSNIGPPPPSPAKFHGLTAFAVPSMNITWQAAWGESVTKIAFSPDSQTLFAAFETERDVLLFDTPTGNPRGRIGMPCTGATTLTSTPDLRHILIHRLDDKKPSPAAANFVEKAIAWLLSIVKTERRSHDTVVVHDAESNAERFRLTGWECDRAWLSGDGATVITIHTEDNGCVMRCWNVGWKPLRWVVGIPAAIGLALIGLVQGYVRWKRQPIPV